MSPINQYKGKKSVTGILEMEQVLMTDDYRRAAIRVCSGDIDMNPHMLFRAIRNLSHNARFMNAVTKMGIGKPAEPEKLRADHDDLVPIFNLVREQTDSYKKMDRILAKAGRPSMAEQGF